MGYPWNAGEQLNANDLNAAIAAGIAGGQWSAGVVATLSASFTIVGGELRAVGAPPTGAAGGGLTGTYPNPTVATVPASALPALTGDVTTSAGAVATTLATVNANIGSFGDGTHVTALTVNAKGLVTAASSVAITGAAPSGAAGGGLAGTYPNPTVAAVPASALPALTGDVTTSAGSAATTLAAGSASNLNSGTLAAARGGTGVSNASTITLGGNLTTSGAFATTLTMTAATSVTLPTTGTLGYINLPQNSQSAAYTTVLADQGKHLLHPSADVTARTFTIDSNANVAYPIGTAITFVNQASAGVMTIAITSDTMRLAGAGTTGSRTLAANGVATAIKVTATEWIISGTNLT